MNKESEYVLGTNSEELDRLGFQQEVWGDVTGRFLNRLGLGAGASVADLGCGPGFLLDEWLARVGDAGRVVLVDESEHWHEHLTEVLRGRDLPHVRCVRARVEEVELEPESCDLIFMRWVLSFVPDPVAVVERAARALKPGGVFAVQDYNHEGISLFPESQGFRDVIRATRALYRNTGGDVWVGGRLPAVFRAAGLEPGELVPNVLGGGPESPAYRWADAFFPAHVDKMVEGGVLTAEERERFSSEWAERRANPDALFFSPVVVDATARKPLS
jgi:SAM-dependent methyltransferase